MAHPDQAFMDEIKSRVPVSLVAGRHVELKRAGREFVGLSPFKSERTGSFTVNDQKGFYHCFATGEHGDAVDLLMKLEGLRFTEAKSVLAGLAGMDPGQVIDTATGEKYKKQAARRDAAARIAEEKTKRKYKDRALDIWASCFEAQGSFVEDYLAGRRIDLDAFEAVYGYRVPPTLRFSPQLYHSCEEFSHGNSSQARACAAGATRVGRKYRGERSRIIAPPAMVAVVQNVERHVTGIHRTWLSEDGQRKADLKPAKKTLGTIWGGGIRLSKPAAHCVIGEGIETTLSVMGALAAYGEVVFGLCGVSLGNISGAGLKPRLKRGEKPPQYIRKPDLARPGLVLLEGVKQVTLCADADGKDPANGLAMMDRAANKFREMGCRDVRIAAPEMGGDFNDMVAG